MSKYIALDVGSKTIGIAKSDGIIASPLETIRFTESNFTEASEKLIIVINEQKPESIIVGYPKNMNGSVGHRVEMVDEFINTLQNKYDLSSYKIVKIDERLTTKMARDIMISADVSRKKQKEKKDSLAAQLILETFLNRGY